MPDRKELNENIGDPDQLIDELRTKLNEEIPDRSQRLEYLLSLRTQIISMLQVSSQDNEHLILRNLLDLILEITIEIFFNENDEINNDALSELTQLDLSSKRLIIKTFEGINIYKALEPFSDKRLQIIEHLISLIPSLERTLSDSIPNLSRIIQTKIIEIYELEIAYISEMIDTISISLNDEDNSSNLNSIQADLEDYIKQLKAIMQKGLNDMGTKLYQEISRASEISKRVTILLQGSEVLEQ